MRQKKTGNPILLEKEVAHEISKRTGVPINTVIQMMYTYFDIIKECIASGVEVKMASLGVMRWKVKKPRHNVVYWNFQTHQNDPPREVPGFWEPCFDAKVQWKKELKAVSKFWEKENDEEREIGEEDAL